jgi:hypothetical protein
MFRPYEAIIRQLLLDVNHFTAWAPRQYIVTYRPIVRQRIGKHHLPWVHGTIGRLFVGNVSVNAWSTIEYTYVARKWMCFLLWSDRRLYNQTRRPAKCELAVQCGVLSQNAVGRQNRVRHFLVDQNSGRFHSDLKLQWDCGKSVSRTRQVKTENLVRVERWIVKWVDQR